MLGFVFTGSGDICLYFQKLPNKNTIGCLN